METVKDSLKKEFSHLQQLLVKSMNDRMDEKIQFHLEQQSERFDTNLEELDNTTANIEDKIDIHDQKFDNIGRSVSNVVEKIECVVKKSVKKLEKNVEKLTNETKELQSINPLYHNNKLVRFAEEGSSGVIFSPSGDSITCSSSEGGGACLNIGSKESDTGKYEWIFKYKGDGSGDVWFGFCNNMKLSSSWNLDSYDTYLWNPENGDIYTNNKHEPLSTDNNGIQTRKREGILRFVYNIDDDSSVDVWADGSDYSIPLWDGGSISRYPCVCFKNNSEHKLLLFSRSKS